MIDCKFIYIAEAHAQDEWPIGNQFFRSDTSSLFQTHSLEARRKTAQTLLEQFPLEIPIWIDDPLTNQFQNNYSPWPLRWYVIDEKGILSFIGQSQDATLSLVELERHL